MEPNGSVEVNASDSTTEVKASKKAILERLSKICKELVEEDKKFGDGKRLVKFEIDGDKEGMDQFAAAAMFGHIRFEDEDTATTHSVPVVIKTEPGDKDTREFFHSHFQFSNEILFYTQLLPFLNSFQVESPRKTSANLGKSSAESAKSSYPFAKFLKGGRNDPVLLSYIIMENASNEGFRLSENRQLLDLDHFLLLMDRLGRFHALSYIAKHVNPSRFFELTAQTKETSWTDERLLNGHESEIFIRESVTRSIKRFDNSTKKESLTGIEKSCNIADKSESFEKYQDQVDKVKSLISEARKPIRFMRDITTGKEPMVVLCHGDFCRNNILFQYNNSTSSSPKDVLFFDMATVRYASPVIDLSFCIYLNSDEELRRLHWDDILKSYHDGLKDAVEAYAKANGVEVTEGKSNYTVTKHSIFLPSLVDVHSEFYLHALYGFVHCSFFLPIMLAEKTAMDDLIPEGKEFWNLTLEEKLHIQNSLAGDEGTRMLNDIVRHVFDMGFV